MSLKDNFKLSNKHLKIDKANQLILIAASISIAAVMFSVIASQALIKQMKYQNLVISKRNQANNQLAKNVKAVQPLVASYETFDGSPESVLGSKEKNSKIVLDALPSKYDFPALATSLEGIMAGSGVKIDGISGTDDEASAAQDSASPAPIEIPFSLSGTGNFGSVQKLIADLQRSIRPVQINNLSFTGSDSTLQISVSAKTYYQPERKLEIKESVVPAAGVKKKTVTATKTSTSSTSATGATK
jgi:Tfp pilus assembly protein PilO